MILNDLVEKLIREHIGGQRFFDNLDDAVRSPDYFKKLWELHSFNDIYGYQPGIILTGKFGVLFANWLSANNIKRQVFIVNGGMRWKGQIDDLTPFFNSIKGEYILFDDSLYSGHTRNLIRDHIDQLGGKLIKTYVVYDGSKEKDDKVASLYRYYDMKKEEKQEEENLVEEFNRMISEGGNE